MARYARGDLAHRLPVDPGRADELQLLVRQFNRMGDESWLRSAPARGERGDPPAWQGVARSLAHELKNPLTAMRMAVARLARSQGPPALSADATAAAADAADAEARRCESLALVEGQIDTLLRLAQSFSAFRQAARSGAADDRGSAAGRGCLRSLPSDVPRAGRMRSRRGDAARGRRPLERGLGNLVKNALEPRRPAASPCA